MIKPDKCAGCFYLEVKMEEKNALAAGTAKRKLIRQKVKKICHWHDGPIKSFADLCTNWTKR